MKPRRSAKDTFQAWAPPGVFRREIEPRGVRKAQSELDRVPDDEPPTDYDPDCFYRTVTGIMRRKESILVSLEFSELRRLPWILFYSPQGEHDSQWIACDSGIFEDYEKWLLEERRTSGPIRALVHEFMRVYPRDIETFDAWKNLIQRALQSNRARSLEGWRTACKRHSLLEWNAPERFVAGLILDKEMLGPRLASANFDKDLLRACNFLRVGVSDFIGRYRAQIGRPELSEISEERLLEFLTLDGRIRFDDRGMRVDIAQVLLDRYRYRSPSRPHLDRLRNWFVRHFGNPHLPPHRRRGWAGVPDSTRMVIAKWLVDFHIDRFIDLIKETAMDRHWRFREAFWRSLSQRNLIHEISFALGGHAKALFTARGMSRELEGSVGELRGAEPSQSVLLMRLPGLTIAEWSHNGSCRIWLHGHPNEPRLFQDCYHAGSLRTVADFVQPHLGSDGYVWQSRIAEWLRQNNGPDIRRADYQIGNMQAPWSRE